MHTVGSLSAYLAQNLGLRHDPREAGNMATWIVEKVLGLSRVQVILEAGKPATEAQFEQIQSILGALRSGRPLQYVLGEAPFMDLELQVDERVLIPRPETEELVAWALDLISGAAPHVLDVGTGSGCIALALKSKVERAQVWACDISKGALEVASGNAQRLGLQVDFMELDILEAQPVLPPLQLLISNPPYIGADEAETLEDHVLKFEPKEALFAGADPLLFYQAIAEQGKDLLAPEGQILVELHSAYAHETKALFERSGYQTDMRQDLQGKWRMLRAFRAQG